MTGRLAALVYLTLVAWTSPVCAHSVTYTGSLLGGAEVPAADTTGHGFAHVTVDFDFVTMRVEVTFANLKGNVTAAHIHCCVNPGSNVGVATQLPTFTDFPSGATSGIYNHTFDLADPLSYNPSFIANHGGTVSSAFNALVAGLDAGQAYLNIHTITFPAGEIRALLQPVPAPATNLLMLGGLFGLIAMWRRNLGSRFATRRSDFN